MSSVFKCVTLHLFVLPRITIAAIPLLIQSTRTTALDAERETTAKFVHQLLIIATELNDGNPDRLPSWRRRMWFFLRAQEFMWIVVVVSFLPRHLLTEVDDQELNEITRLSEAALAHYEAGGAEVIDSTKRWKRVGAVLWRQMRAIWRAMFHVLVSTAHLRAMTGDLAQNLDTARTHYQQAIAILEREQLSTLSLCAVGVRIAFAKTLVDYPTRNRLQYCDQAIEILREAEMIVEPYAKQLNPVIVELIFQSNPRKRDFPRFALLLLKTLPNIWQGVVGPFLLNFSISIITPLLSIQLLIAYRRAGRHDKAIDFAMHRIRVTGCPGFESLDAKIELEKGFAYLESTGSNRRSNIAQAAQAFQNALTLCRVKRGIRADAINVYILAILGDARAYFAYRELGVISLNRHRTVYPIVTRQLREAARLAKEYAMLPASRDALSLLGVFCAAEGDYSKSYRALIAASRIGTSLERRTRTQRLQRHWVREMVPLYELLVPVTMAHSNKLGGSMSRRSFVFHSALDYAERGRAVWLQAELGRRRMLPKGSREDDPEIETLFELRRKWQESELMLLEQESASSRSERYIAEVRNRSESRERSYLAALSRVRDNFHDRDYDPDRPLRQVRYNEILATVRALSADGAVALVEYFVSDRDLRYFVVLPTKTVHGALSISRGELESIQRQWAHGLELLRRGSAYSGFWESGVLRQTLHRLEAAAEVPMNAIRRWEQESKRKVRRIIVIPHRFLHLLPMHAIPLGNGKTWGESMPISYVPSAAVLCELEKTGFPPLPEVFKIVTVAYSAASNKAPAPNQSLLFHREEARAVQQSVGGIVLRGKRTTPNAVKSSIADADFIHFSCHAQFDSQNSLDSALILAPAEPGSPSARFTAGEIFESVRLSRARLVVLSACETGMTKVDPFYDECIGLPAAFLIAGARTVVSTLWRVPDLVSWLLMRMMWNEIRNGTETWEALRISQNELRGLSLAAVQELVHEAASRQADPLRGNTMMEEGERLFGDHPFASPYWWAGFTINGLG
jgi:CHAT domain-containing protein